MSNIGQYRSEINKTLQLYYYTFIDIVDFKDHVSELFAVMDACHVELDIVRFENMFFEKNAKLKLLVFHFIQKHGFVYFILQTLNYDLTKGYLDLVVAYVSLMILISRVEDRKAVLGLFHVSQEMANNPE